MAFLRSIFIFLAIILACTKCTKVDTDNIVNLNNGKIDVIGHGGAGFQSLINPLPTNSFISIRNAIDGLNADGVEIDLQVSKDGVPILFHDAPLEKSTSCTGCINEKTAEELIKCRYYNYYGSQVLKDETLITFSSLVDYFKDRSKKPRIYLNVKKTRCLDETTNIFFDVWTKQIIRSIQEKNAYDFISIYDGDTNYLKKVREIDPNVKIEYNAQKFEEGLTVCISQKINTMIIANEDISKDQVILAHKNNIRVILWQIIRRKDAVDAIGKNPDGIMTDNIPIIQEVLQN